jgi:hypothetical protein
VVAGEATGTRIAVGARAQSQSAIVVAAAAAVAIEDAAAVATRDAVQAATARADARTTAANAVVGAAGAANTVKLLAIASSKSCSE